MESGETKDRSKTLNAGSAAIIFLACFFVQAFVDILLYAIGGERLGPLADCLSAVVGIVVMVSVARNLIPEDIRRAGPTGAAWILGGWDAVIKGLIIGSFVGLVTMLLERLYHPHNIHRQQTTEPIFHAVVTPGIQQLAAIVGLIVLAPVLEEMIYRGVLYGGIRKSLGPLWAAIITTGIFVAGHFSYYIHIPHWIFFYIIVALVLLWCRLHWNAIGPAIAAHGGYNLVVAVIPALIFTWQHACYESGVADYKASNFNQAIARLTRAIQLGDESTGVYMYRGNAKFREGDMDGAITDYSKVIDLNPKDSTAFYDRGLAKDRRENFAGAIDDYDEAIVLDPNRVKAYEDRGLAKVSEGEFEAAIADYDRAIELSPTNSIYYNNRGWAKFLKGDFVASIVDATRSIQIDPGFAYAYGTRGWARYGIGGVSGAVDDCKRSTHLYKSDSAPYFYDQGLLDFIAADYKKAIADWQKAIELAPDSKKELLPWIEKAQEKLQK